MHELDPIALATADNPYPYYNHLVADRPFSYHDGRGMFVAASALAVETVLSCDMLRVGHLPNPFLRQSTVRR